MIKKLLFGVALLTTTVSLWAQESSQEDYVSEQISRQKVIDNGGGGRYRAVIATEKTMPDYTVYRPRFVKAAARHEGKLPILIWCNGACSDNSKGYERMLNEMASQGYMVMAIGKMKVNDNDREDGGSNERQVVTIINWLVNQAADPSSDYYQAIDVNNIALAGHSCGGAQAIANCVNSRVKTLLIMNAGMGGMSMGGASPQTLKQLHCPIIYMTGGPDDVAYGNARSDFGNIKNVPVVWADLPTAGHGGTYWNPGGGEFGRLAIKWMNWHLKGFDGNARTFLMPDKKDFPSWNIQHQNFGTVDYESPFKDYITVANQVFDRQAAENTFAFGADLSMLTQQTQAGKTFCNRDGARRPAMTILKEEEGMNSVRISVVVSSTGTASLSYAKGLANQAKALNMNVMLTIHYVDNLKDMGSQKKPAAWNTHDADALAKDVSDHTTAVVKAIKETGVALRWVQVGYQMDEGMLWPEGKLNTGKDNFVKFFNSAYDAIKALDENIQVVLHYAEGHASATTLNNYFDGLKNAGAKWDAIGLSAYPKVSGYTNSILARKATANVKSLKERYEMPVLVVETGCDNSKPLESNLFLSSFLQQLIEAGGDGLFYWEPELTDDYNLGAWNPLNRKVSIALDAFNGHQLEEVPYVMTIHWDIDKEKMYDGKETISLPVEAVHVRDRIAKVDLLKDKEVVATSTEKPFTIEWKDAQPGLHSIHALATATDGATASTDTVTVLIGPATTIEDEAIADTVNAVVYFSWPIEFKQAGDYLLVFKYQAEDRQYARIYADDDAIGSFTFTVTKDEMKDYQSKVFTADATGIKSIRLKMSLRGALPDISSLIVIPLNGQELPEAAEATAVNEIAAQSNISVEAHADHIYAEANSSIKRVLVYNISGILIGEGGNGSSNSVRIPLSRTTQGSLVVVLVETQTGTKTFYTRLKK